MRLVEPRLLPEPGVPVPMRHAPEGGAASQTLVLEHELALYVNGEAYAGIVCTPTLLSELVLGRLLSAGRIAALGDVEELVFSEDASRADALLSPVHLPEPAPLTPIPFDWAWIGRMSEMLRARLPLHRATFGAHGCILMREGEILCCCEDMSRHNAMDKALGWALRSGVALRECILFTSARVPRDMVWKAIRAGVPVLAGKSLPTAQAVELAKRYGLTLAGHAWPDGAKLFSPVTME